HICGCDIVGFIQDAKVGPKRIMVYPGISCHKCPQCRAGSENLCSSFGILGGLSDYNGGYAERVAVPRTNVITLPASLESRHAAALAVSYLTAWNMLRTNGARKGTSLLVYGGASGVGMATIQLAKALGALVITTASTAAKEEFSRL